MRAAGIALLACFSAGCASSLGVMRGPRVVEKFHVEAVGANGISLPVGMAWGAANDAVAIVSEVNAGVQQGRPPNVSAEQGIRLGTVAAAFLVQPPAWVPELNVRTGVWDRVDVGLRVSGLSLRFDTGVQLYEGPDWKVLATGGVARHFFGGDLLNFLSDVKLARFERTDFDLGVVVGQAWEFGAIYFGPKLVLSHFVTDGLLLKEKRIQVGPVEAPVDLGFDLGNAYAYGAVAGMRVGWKYVFFTAELGVYGSSFRPRVLGQTFDLGGLVVFPTVGIVVNI
jgi:hypothetical protein